MFHSVFVCVFLTCFSTVATAEIAPKYTGARSSNNDLRDINTSRHQPEVLEENLSDGEQVIGVGPGSGAGIGQLNASGNVPNSKSTAVPLTKSANKSATKSQLARPTELEQQQKILEQFKPLIKPREYADLITYSDKSLAPLALNRLPDLNEVIVPGRAPNIRMIPYLRKSFAHPAYETRYQGKAFFIAVNCEGPGAFDDCSTTPHNQFANKSVYVRFVQTSDPAFQPVIGMRVGRSYGEVKHLFEARPRLHGGGECLETSTEWLACFDGNQMKVNKERLEMMPSHQAKLMRFLKIKGRAYWGLLGCWVLNRV